MKTSDKIWVAVVAVSAISFSAVLAIHLSKPEKAEFVAPIPTTSSITSVAPEASQQATDPIQETLPVTPVAYEQAVEVGQMKIATGFPSEEDHSGEIKTVLKVKVVNSGSAFEFAERYAFQFISKDGEGSLAADTLGFKMLLTGVSFNGEVQVEGPFKDGTLLLIERESGMPVAAWK
jgi:hypothetical protein